MADLAHAACKERDDGADARTGRERCRGCALWGGRSRSASATVFPQPCARSSVLSAVGAGCGATGGPGLKEGGLLSLRALARGSASGKLCPCRRVARHVPRDHAWPAGTAGVPRLRSSSRPCPRWVHPRSRAVPTSPATVSWTGLTSPTCLRSGALALHRGHAPQTSAATVVSMEQTSRWCSRRGESARSWCQRGPLLSRLFRIRLSSMTRAFARRSGRRALPGACATRRRRSSLS